MPLSQSVIDSLLHERSEHQAKIDAIDILLKDSVVRVESPEQHVSSFLKELQPGIAIPSEYEPNLIWDDKVLYMLNKLGTAYSIDIINEISDEEPNIEEKKLDNGVNQALNKLKNLGTIKVIGNSGRKFKYAINK